MELYNDLLPDPPLAWIAGKAADKGLHFIDDRSPPDADGTPKSAPKMPAAFELVDTLGLPGKPVDTYFEFFGQSLDQTGFRQLFLELFVP